MFKRLLNNYIHQCLEQHYKNLSAKNEESPVRYWKWHGDSQQFTQLEVMFHSLDEDQLIIPGSELHKKFIELELDAREPKIYLDIDDMLIVLNGSWFYDVDEQREVISYDSEGTYLYCSESGIPF